MDELVRYAMSHLDRTYLEVTYTSLHGGQLAIWLGQTQVMDVMPEPVVGFSTWTKRRGLLSHRSGASVKQSIRRLEKQYSYGEK